MHVQRLELIKNLFKFEIHSLIQIMIAPTCCGKVCMMQFGGTPDEAEAAPAAADGPSRNGHGGVDCAHAGCGGAVGLMLTC